VLLFIATVQFTSTFHVTRFARPPHFIFVIIEQHFGKPPHLGKSSQANVNTSDRNGNEVEVANNK